MLQEDFKEFLVLLKENKVEYLLVGGYAVSFYGYPRNTGDMDIWIKNDYDNLEKIVRVINKFGFSSLSLTVKDFEIAGTVVQLGFPPVRIDILNDLDGLIFSDCYNHKKQIDIDNIQVNIISIEDLIKNKKSTGRHIDLADVEKLEYIIKN